MKRIRLDCATLRRARLVVDLRTEKAETGRQLGWKGEKEKKGEKQKKKRWQVVEEARLGAQFGNK